MGRIAPRSLTFPSRVSSAPIAVGEATVRLIAENPFFYPISIMLLLRKNLFPSCSMMNRCCMAIMSISPGFRLNLGISNSTKFSRLVPSGLANWVKPILPSDRWWLRSTSGWWGSFWLFWGFSCHFGSFWRCLRFCWLFFTPKSNLFRSRAT